MNKFNIVLRPVEEFKYTFCLPLERIFYLEKSWGVFALIIQEIFLLFVHHGWCWDSQQKFGELNKINICHMIYIFWSLSQFRIWYIFIKFQDRKMLQF